MESEPAYGALPYYQFHFVVTGGAMASEERLIARTRKKTRGVIHKQVTDLHWEGSWALVERLNGDDGLRSLLTKVLLEEGDIYIDPTESGVRIHGHWKSEFKVRMSREALEAYDMIAGHVKRYLAELASH